MNIGVFGGTRGVGLEFIKQALELNHKVTVLARNPTDIDSKLKSENLKII